MGFHDVSYSHGIQEFGKDILFRDFDRFGTSHWLGAQVKFGDVDGKAARRVDEIESQVRSALGVAFEDLLTKERTYLSAVYVVISGRFTANAKTLLIERLRDKRNWIHFVDGDRIAALHRASFQDIVRALVSLQREMLANLEFAEVVKAHSAKQDGYLYYSYEIDHLTHALRILTPLDEFSDITAILEKLRVELVKGNHALKITPLATAVRDPVPEYSYLEEQAGTLQKFIPVVREQIANTIARVARG